MKNLVKSTLLVALISLSSLNIAFGANILFYWGMSGMSHRISVWPLVEKLVDLGHNITFFSPFPPKKPNPKVIEITPENLLSDIGLHQDFLSIRINEGTEGISKVWTTFFDMAIRNCEAIGRNPHLINWIEHSSYDLVIINGMFNDCGYGLVHKFKAPHIIYGCTSPFDWWSEAYGYFDENYPEFQYHYPENMTFLEGVSNALRPLYWHWNRHFYMFPKIEGILREELNMKDLPPLREIEGNPSLVFLNTHFTEEFPRSLPPLFVPIGGMHCTDKIKPLPKDILDFIESKGTGGSEEDENSGFIYFSFGTFAKPEAMPKSLQQVFFNTMATFNRTKFLVKWQDEETQGLSTNIKKVRWISQQDVLAHPKIKGFISHGGLLGTQEAVFHGVPMIVIPLFAEQDLNAERIAGRGRGVRLEIVGLTQDKLAGAISQILNNNSDRPSDPVDTAVWWVEYVLRHGGNTSHLHPIGIKRNWIQRRMLDIWAFIFLLITLSFIAISLITFFFIKTIFKIKSNATTKPKKTQIPKGKKIN